MAGEWAHPQEWGVGGDRPLLDSADMVIKLWEMWKSAGGILIGINMYNWLIQRPLTIIDGGNIINF